MKSRIFLFLCVILAIGIALAYLLRSKPITVLVKAAERGRIEATVANTRAGTVKACRRALLAPAIGGQIFQLPVREGMEVKTGDLLLVLWNEDLQAEVRLAASKLRRPGPGARQRACRPILPSVRPNDS